MNLNKKFSKLILYSDFILAARNKKGIKYCYDITIGKSTLFLYSEASHSKKRLKYCLKIYIISSTSENHKVIANMYRKTVLKLIIQNFKVIDCPSRFFPFLKMISITFIEEYSSRKQEYRIYRELRSNLNLAYIILPKFHSAFFFTLEKLKKLNFLKFSSDAVEIHAQNSIFRSFIASREKQIFKCNLSMKVTNGYQENMHAMNTAEIFKYCDAISIKNNSIGFIEEFFNLNKKISPNIRKFEYRESFNSFKYSSAMNSFFHGAKNLTKLSLELNSYKNPEKFSQDIYFPSQISDFALYIKYANPFQEIHSYEQSMFFANFKLAKNLKRLQITFYRYDSSTKSEPTGLRRAVFYFFKLVPSSIESFRFLINEKDGLDFKSIEELSKKENIKILELSYPEKSNIKFPSNFKLPLKNIEEFYSNPVIFSNLDQSSYYKIEHLELVNDNEMLNYNFVLELFSILESLTKLKILEFINHSLLAVSENTLTGLVLKIVKKNFNLQSLRLLISKNTLNQECEQILSELLRWREKLIFASIKSLNISLTKK